MAATEDDLLKQATQKKRSGDLQGAIGCLRAAYRIMAQGGLLWRAVPYLRLPAYLQLAGEHEAAWGELVKMADGGYPICISNRAIRAQVYEHMAGFQARRGDFQLAARYSLLAGLSSWQFRASESHENPESEPKIKENELSATIATAEELADSYVEGVGEPDLRDFVIETLIAGFRRGAEMSPESVVARSSRSLLRAHDRARQRRGLRT